MDGSERNTLVAIFIILGLLAVGSVWVFSGGGYWGMRPGMMGGYYGWGWMPFLMMAFWVIIGVGVYLIYRSWASNRHPEPSEASRDSALSIARERLARGEITAEEYERIKKTLEG